MANIIQQKSGVAAPAGGISKSELVIRHVDAAHTTANSSMLYIGEDADNDGVTIRALGTGMTGDSGQGGATIGGSMTFTGGNSITTSVSGAVVTINHDDSSSQASVNNSGSNFIQDITLDTYGHVTGITSAAASGGSGDITGVTAGTGLSGGGSSGGVTPSLGTLTSLTVDDITINGSTISDSGSFVLDVGGDITLDANGGDIMLKDDGTMYGVLTNNGGELKIKSSDTASLTLNDADVTVEDDLFVKDNIYHTSDGSITGWGVDTDVTLTHVADTGLLLNSTRQLQFNDASQKIYASSGTILNIEATDEVQLDATLFDINANADVSGTLTVAGDFTANNIYAAGSTFHVGDTNTYIGFTGNDTIEIQTGGASRVSINDAGFLLGNTGARVTTINTSFADNDTTLMTSQAIKEKIENYGYTTATGDITGVTAGTGLSGGGSSGGVTLNVDAAQTQITSVGTIGTGVWQGTAIASGYIAGDAITGAKIADNAIDSEHYTDGSIDNAHIADDAINSEHYAAGSIDTAHIADDQVTYAKIQNVSATDRILGRDSSGAGVIEEITPANLRTMLNVEDGATNGGGTTQTINTINSTGLTVDSSGDITLDAAGNDIFLLDAGTKFGTINNDSNGLKIMGGNQTSIATIKTDSSGLLTAGTNYPFIITAGMSNIGTSSSERHLSFNTTSGNSGTALHNHYFTIPFDCKLVGLYASFSASIVGSGTTFRLRKAADGTNTLSDHYKITNATIDPHAGITSMGEAGFANAGTMVNFLPDTGHTVNTGSAGVQSFSAGDKIFGNLTVASSVGTGIRGSFTFEFVVTGGGLAQ